MRLQIAGPLALFAACSASAQDLSTAIPATGSWSYAPATDGSEAVFTSASGSPQLWLHCTRATRRITFSRPATAATAFIKIWTSSQTRSVASSFNPATGRVTIEVAAFDSLLDAIASSRGRIAFTVGPQPPLVVPPWAEPARVIEDCRV
jgi:hypothetical protein